MHGLVRMKWWGFVVNDQGHSHFKNHVFGQSSKIYKLWYNSLKTFSGYLMLSLGIRRGAHDHIQCVTFCQTVRRFLLCTWAHDLDCQWSLCFCLDKTFAWQVCHFDRLMKERHSKMCSFITQCHRYCKFGGSGAVTMECEFISLPWIVAECYFREFRRTVNQPHNGQRITRPIHDLHFHSKGTGITELSESISGSSSACSLFAQPNAEIMWTHLPWSWKYPSSCMSCILATHVTH